MPGSSKTLEMLKRAHAKLMRLDPEYAAQNARNAQRQQTKTRRAAAYEIDANLRGIAETDPTPIDELLSIATQDDALLDLASEIGAVVQRPRKPLPKAQRFEVKGQSKTLIGWSVETGISLSTLESRVYQLGWSVEDAVSRPLRIHRQKKQYVFEGQSRSIEQWASATGICESTIANRLRSGWSIGAALTVPAGTLMGTRSHNGGWTKASQKAFGTSGVGLHGTELNQDFFQVAEEMEPA